MRTKTLAKRLHLQIDIPWKSNIGTQNDGIFEKVSPFQIMGTLEGGLYSCLGFLGCYHLGEFDPISPQGEGHVTSRHHESIHH